MPLSWFHLWRLALVLCVTIKGFRDQFCGNSGLRSVPLMGAAAVAGDRESVLSWLANACDRAGNVSVDGVDTIGHDAVFEAWHALSGVLSREDLSEWIHRQGFVQPWWRGHFSGRAQEGILTTAVLTDARVWAFESAHVRVVVLHARGQAPPCEAPQSVASVHQSEPVPDSFPDSCWAVMDDANLQDILQEKFSTLQSCPQSFRGRFRHASRQVLEVRHEAVNSCDEVTEERAWKAFCLLLFLLFRRPGHGSKVSKEDLRRRFDSFAHGTWEILVDDVVATLAVQVKPRSEGPLSAEQRGTWLPRKSCWARSHVPVSV